MNNTNLFTTMVDLFNGNTRRGALNSKEQRQLEALRRTRALRRRLRKQEILKAGCDMGNAQALVRRAERRLHGHVVTPLHSPVLVETLSQNTNK